MESCIRWLCTLAAFAARPFPSLPFPFRPIITLNQANNSKNRHNSINQHDAVAAATLSCLCSPWYDSYRATSESEAAPLRDPDPALDAHTL